MKQLVKIPAKEAAKLDLPSIELLEVTESTGGDIRHFSFRDKANGNELHLRCGGYHEMTAFVVKPKELKKVFRLEATLADARVTKDFEHHSDAQEFANNNHLGNVVITETEVEVE